MQEADVGRRFSNDLAVELEHEPQHAVRRRMRRPHVQNHFLAYVVIATFAQLCLFGGDSRHRIGRFNLADGKSHKIDNLLTLPPRFPCASSNLELNRAIGWRW